MIEVSRANPVDLQVLHGDCGAHFTEGYIAVSGNRIIASGGFSEDDGKLWASFDVFEPGHGFELFHAVRKALDSVGTVHAPCNAKYPKAGRLLKLLGFEPTDEVRNGMTVWRR